MIIRKQNLKNNIENWDACKCLQEYEMSLPSKIQNLRLRDHVKEQSCVCQSGK